MKKLFSLLLALALLLCACDVPSAPSQGGDATEGSTTDAPSTEPALFPPVTYTPSRRQVPFTPPVQMGNLQDARPWDGVYLFPPRNESATALIARVVSPLPDTYQFIVSQRSGWDVNLLLMQTLKTVEGHTMPEYFYLIRPDTSHAILDTSHAYLLHTVYQQAAAPTALYNRTARAAEIMDLPIFSVSTSSHLASGATVVAYPANRWQGEEALSALQSIAREYDRTGVATPNTVVFTADPDHLTWLTGQSSGFCLADDLKQGETLLPKGIPYRYTRFLGGYPTAEIYTASKQGLLREEEAHIPDEEASSLPDLNKAREKIYDDVRTGRLVPSHLQSYATLRFIGHDVFGWYTRLEGETVGVVRVVWHYEYASEAPAYGLVLMDDCYFTVRADGSITEIADTVLAEQEGNTAYLIGAIGKYGALGKLHDGFPSDALPLHGQEGTI